MEYICYANQDYPKEQFNKVFKSKQTKITIYNYLEILKNNEISNLDILNELEEKGCTYAYVANLLVTKLIMDSNSDLSVSDIKETFGFSLNSDINNLDCNMLMLDIFAFLYDKVKLTLHKYETYHYKNAKEAMKALFNKDIDNEETAILELLNKNIRPDGIDEITKKNKYKKTIPNNQVIYGSYREIAKSLLNTEDKNMNKEKLEKLLLEKDITFEEYDRLPEAKLSGLTAININTWINYYLIQKNINLKFEIEDIQKNDTYIEFQNNLKELLNEGYILSMSSSPNSDVLIMANNTKVKISNQKAGHKMLIIGFDNNNDIIVNSWGKYFIVSQKYYKDFIYDKAKIEIPEFIKHNHK